MSVFDVDDLNDDLEVRNTEDQLWYSMIIPTATVGCSASFGVYKYVHKPKILKEDNTLLCCERGLLACRHEEIVPYPRSSLNSSYVWYMIGYDGDTTKIDYCPFCGKPIGSVDSEFVDSYFKKG